MADAGQQVLAEVLPSVREEHQPDVIVVQAENLTDGRGVAVEDMRKLQDMGVDFLSGGNWTPYLDETHPLLLDPKEPIIGPANFGADPGPGYKYIETAKGRVLFISLLGQVVGRQLPDISNPLKKIDEILETELAKQTPAAIVVNFHGDYSSEKRIIGYYLDGRVSLVVGDHWHVPTADAMVLPKGTGHITDVGMCGSIHSSLGVSLESVIPRWRNEVQTRNIQDAKKPWQFNAVLAEIENGLTKKITQIQRILE